jgi:WD40 repeat protein
VLPGHDDSLSDVAFTPDDKWLITISGTGTIKVWDLSAILTHGVLCRTTQIVALLAISADDRVMAGSDTAGDIHVWDIASGREIKRIPSGEPRSVPGSTDISFSPTDHLLAWAGWTTLGILDYVTFQTNTFPLTRRDGFCNPAFSPDGHELAFANASNIMIIDVATRTPRPFASVNESVYGLSYSPNGTLLASAHDGGAVWLWDRVRGSKITNVVAHSPTAFEVEFSRDGRFLASSGSDKTAMIWEVVPGGVKRLHILPGHEAWVDVRFSPDGQRVVTSSSDNALTLWDTNTGLEVGRLYHEAGFGGAGVGGGVAFSHDGSTIYSATQDREIRIWHAPPLEQLEANMKEKTASK